MKNDFKELFRPVHIYCIMFKVPVRFIYACIVLINSLNIQCLRLLGNPEYSSIFGDRGVEIHALSEVLRCSPLELNLVDSVVLSMCDSILRRYNEIHNQIL